MKKRYWILLLLLFLVQPVIFVKEQATFVPTETSDSITCSLQYHENPAIGIFIINFMGPSGQQYPSCTLKREGENDLQGRFMAFELINTEGRRTSILPEYSARSLDMVYSESENYSHITARKTHWEVMSGDKLYAKGEICDSNKNCEDYSINGHIKVRKKYGIASLTFWRLMSV